jgi:hypothetical protein
MVEAAIISILTTTSTTRATVEVIIPMAVEVVVRATVEVIVALTTAVPAAECAMTLLGARCTFARTPSVRAASASIDIEVVL